MKNLLSNGNSSSETQPGQLDDPSRPIPSSYPSPGAHGSSHSSLAKIRVVPGVSRPGAASSLREGIEETFTLSRLDLRGQLKHARIDRSL